MTVRKSKASTSALRHRGVAIKSVPRDIPADVIIATTRKMLKVQPHLWSGQPGDDILIAEARRGNTKPLHRRIEQLTWSGVEFPEELQTYFKPTTTKMLKELPNIWSALAGDDKLIAEARRGNTEPLARRIEQLIWSGDKFPCPEELLTFFAELVREMPSPNNRPKSYTAFQHSRRRAWFMALCRRAGDSPGAAYRKAEENFAASRRTLVRAWAQNSDLHNPQWVDFLSENSFTWYFEHLADRH